MYIAAFMIVGSSPRMRGAPEYVEQMWAEAGIIPAYAGSTLLAPNVLKRL